MKSLIAVGIGGMIGSIARWGCNLAISKLIDPSIFPLGTFFVNIMGCFLIGLFSEMLRESGHFTTLSLFLITGLLGGFTTFSAFGYETFTLLSEGRISSAFLNVILQTCLGLFFVWIGVVVAAWK
jgi:fluoride exporter